MRLPEGCRLYISPYGIRTWSLHHRCCWQLLRRNSSIWIFGCWWQLWTFLSPTSIFSAGYRPKVTMVSPWAKFCHQHLVIIVTNVTITHSERYKLNDFIWIPRFLDFFHKRVENRYFSKDKFFEFQFGKLKTP